MPFKDSEDRLRRLEEENQQLRRAVDELSVLNELAREIGASRDSKDVMERIVRRSIQALEAEQGVISLVEGDAAATTQTLVRTSSGTGDHPPMRANEQLLGWMHLHREPIHLPDPRHDRRFTGAQWSEEIRSILCVPLMARSDLIGILTVFNKKGGRSFTEADQRLLTIIAAQSAQVVENARLYEEERALLEVRQELRVASDIQTRLLPDRAPVVDGYELAGESRPAQRVGGDYFDFLEMEGGRLAVCVGDVSGKGLPAALLMSNVQASLRARYMDTMDPAATLETLSRLLLRSMRKGSFVTMIYAVVDPGTHELTYANAGHNRPFLCRPDGSVRRLETAGIVLGAVRRPGYRASTVAMQPGSVLLLYSDGISEAMNLRREEFGEAQLVDVLIGARTGTAGEVLDAVTRSVTAHVGKADPHDDMTLLVVKRLE